MQNATLGAFCNTLDLHQAIIGLENKPFFGIFENSRFIHRFNCIFLTVWLKLPTFHYCNLFLLYSSVLTLWHFVSMVHYISCAICNFSNNNRACINKSKEKTHSQFQHDVLRDNKYGIVFWVSFLEIEAPMRVPGVRKNETHPYRIIWHQINQIKTKTQFQLGIFTYFMLWIWLLIYVHK